MPQQKSVFTQTPDESSELTQVEPSSLFVRYTACTAVALDGVTI